MLLVSAVNVSIIMNLIPFCIPLLNVKRLSPSLMKLFPGLTKQTILEIFTNNGRETFWNVA